MLELQLIFAFLHQVQPSASREQEQQRGPNPDHPTGPRQAEASPQRSDRKSIQLYPYLYIRVSRSQPCGRHRQGQPSSCVPTSRHSSNSEQLSSNPSHARSAILQKPSCQVSSLGGMSPPYSTVPTQHQSHLGMELLLRQKTATWVWR